MADKLESLVSRLEKVTGRLESIGVKGCGSFTGGEDDPRWYEDYVQLHETIWKDFLQKTAADQHPDMAILGEKLKNAFDEHKKLLTIAARNGKPKKEDLAQLMKPLGESIRDIQAFRESSRRSPKFNHLSAVAEGILFLFWPDAPSKPAQYVKDMKESTQFYSNKVLKEFRQSDPKQSDWATAFIKLLDGFVEYLKDNHSIGLQWNTEKPAATPASAASGVSAPPPPAVAPPPPPPVQAPGSGSATSSSDTRSALFAQLNKGSSVTSGLKKVTDDMKTHKNPDLRNQGPVATTKSSALSPRPYSPPQFKKFNAPAVTKPPVFELQMKKWRVEYQKDNHLLSIDECSDKFTVYMYKCTNSVLQVNGKVNSIIVDSCSKCGIVFSDLISTFEFINCQSVKAQAKGVVPTISIDKTDGVQIYLSGSSLDAQIITAKSSEMNVCITKEDGDLDEHPLPEQYKTVWDGKRFVTTVMDLNS